LRSAREALAKNPSMGMREHMLLVRLIELHAQLRDGSPQKFELGPRPVQI